MAAHLGSPALAGLKRQAGFTDSAAKPKAPRVDDFEEQQEEQGELDEAQQPELTETLKLGMLNLHGKEQDIMRKIDELMAVGSNFLDDLKADFLRRMERMKENVHNYCGSTEEEWTATSAATLEATARLGAAQALVQRLGLKMAHEPTGSDTAEADAAV